MGFWKKSESGIEGGDWWEDNEGGLAVAVGPVTGPLSCELGEYIRVLV